MCAYIAQNIENEFTANGLEAAQNRYRAWFIKTAIYKNYKAGTDTILVTDGHGDFIVTA